MLLGVGYQLSTSESFAMQPPISKTFQTSSVDKRIRAFVSLRPTRFTESNVKQRHCENNNASQNSIQTLAREVRPENEPVAIRILAGLPHEDHVLLLLEPSLRAESNQ